MKVAKQVSKDFYQRAWACKEVLSIIKEHSDEYFELLDVVAEIVRAYGDFRDLGSDHQEIYRWHRDDLPIALLLMPFDNSYVLTTAYVHYDYLADKEVHEYEVTVDYCGKRYGHISEVDHQAMIAHLQEEVD